MFTPSNLTTLASRISPLRNSLPVLKVLKNYKSERSDDGFNKIKSKLGECWKSETQKTPKFEPAKWSTVTIESAKRLPQILKRYLGQNSESNNNNADPGKSSKSTQEEAEGYLTKLSDCFITLYNDALKKKVELESQEFRSEVNESSNSSKQEGISSPLTPQTVEDYLEIIKKRKQNQSFVVEPVSEQPAKVEEPQNEKINSNLLKLQQIEWILQSFHSILKRKQQNSLSDEEVQELVRLSQKLSTNSNNPVIANTELQDYHSMKLIFEALDKIHKKHESAGMLQNLFTPFLGKKAEEESTKSTAILEKASENQDLKDSEPVADSSVKEKAQYVANPFEAKNIEEPVASSAAPENLLENQPPDLKQSKKLQEANNEVDFENFDAKPEEVRKIWRENQTSKAEGKKIDYAKKLTEALEEFDVKHQADQKTVMAREIIDSKLQVSNASVSLEPKPKPIEAAEATDESVILEVSALEEPKVQLVSKVSKTGCKFQLDLNNLENNPGKINESDAASATVAHFTPPSEQSTVPLRSAEMKNKYTALDIFEQEELKESRHGNEFKTDSKLKQVEKNSSKSKLLEIADETSPEDVFLIRQYKDHTSPETIKDKKGWEVSNGEELTEHILEKKGSETGCKFQIDLKLLETHHSPQIKVNIPDPLTEVNALLSSKQNSKSLGSIASKVCAHEQLKEEETVISDLNRKDRKTGCKFQVDLKHMKNHPIGYEEWAKVSEAIPPEERPYKSPTVDLQFGKLVRELPPDTIHVENQDVNKTKELEDQTKEGISKQTAELHRLINESLKEVALKSVQKTDKEVLDALTQLAKEVQSHVSKANLLQTEISPIKIEKPGVEEINANKSHQELSPVPTLKKVVGSAEVINFGTRIEAILSVDSKDSKSEATKEAILDELEKRILKRLEEKGKEKGDKNIKGLNPRNKNE